MKYINDFLEYLTVIKKHSENTIINYKNDLLEFNNFTNNNLLNIEKNKVNSYLEYLYNQNVSKSTISRKLSSLRTFYDYLVKKKIIEFNYFHQVKNPHKDLSLPKFVKEEDIDKMFEVPNLRTPISIRNNLIIHMLYSTGVRVSELVNIKLEDINQKERTIRILGKGSKERVVIYGKNTAESLELYLNSGRPFLGIHQNEYLFLNKDGTRLSDRYIRKIINEIIFKGSIKMHVTPHMLRHTFATSMLNNGADLVNVKDLLGHESLNTTSIYTHVTDEKIKEIYHNAHPRA